MSSGMLSSLGIFLWIGFEGMYNIGRLQMMQLVEGGCVKTSIQHEAIFGEPRVLGTAHIHSTVQVHFTLCLKDQLSM